jgi:hypothetical protein
MPSLYIILEKQIINADIYVNGNHLSKNSDELGRIAKQRGVRPLMDFFIVSGKELSSLAEEYSPKLDKITKQHQENWFTAEQGLQTVNTLLQNLASSKLEPLDRIKTELQEFARVLEIAKANGLRWHLGVDY